MPSRTLSDIKAFGTEKYHFFTFLIKSFFSIKGNIDKLITDDKFQCHST